jgi:hypothetical protein
MAGARILIRMTSGSGSVSGDGQPGDGQWLETVGIADIVMTILEARKTKPSATAAAVSRESCGDVIHVRVSLLEGSPPSGGPPQDRPDHSPDHGDVIAAFTVRRLGADLAAAFGPKDVIILK